MGIGILLAPGGPNVTVDVRFFTFKFTQIHIKAACNNSGTLSAAYPKNSPRYPPALPNKHNMYDIIHLDSLFTIYNT